MDETRSGEIRSGKARHQIGQRAVRVLENEDQRINDFRKVVWRDVRRHADGDAGRAVDQQIGNGRGQNGRLLPCLVVVGDVIDGVFVDVAQHFLAEAGHARLGITHGGGRVAVHRAEVPLPVNQRVAQREILRHAHQ